MKRNRSNQRRYAKCRRSECGIVSAFVAVAATALFVVAGFTVDVGRAIAVQRLAANEAQQAARAGADQISIQSLRQGHVVIDVPAATRAAESFMAGSGYPGVARVDGEEVFAKVVIAMPTSALGIVGVNTITVSATESASDLVGVTRRN